MITLASLIAAALEKPDATQEKIAEKANLSQPRLSELLNGKGLPRARGIPPLADAIGVEPGYLARVIAAQRRRLRRPHALNVAGAK